jgi:hypothetical protein
MAFNLKEMATEYIRHKIEYNLVNRFILTNNASKEDGKDLANKYLQLSYKHDSLAWRLVETMDKCRKLEAENEFMLKLINRYMVGE